MFRFLFAFSWSYIWKREFNFRHKTSSIIWKRVENWKVLNLNDDCIGKQGGGESSCAPISSIAIVFSVFCNAIDLGNHQNNYVALRCQEGIELFTLTLTELSWCWKDEEIFRKWLYVNLILKAWKLEERKTSVEFSVRSGKLKKLMKNLSSFSCEISSAFLSPAKR